MSQGITGTLALLTLLFFAGSHTSPRAAVLTQQGGSIRGKIVADIPDQRRALPGVVVHLSGERLGDKKLDGHRGKVIDIVPSSKRRGEPDIKVEMVGGPGDGKKVTVKPNNVMQAPDKARFDPSIGRDKSDQSIIEGLRERVKNWRDLADAERAANTEVTVRPVAPDLRGRPGGDHRVRRAAWEASAGVGLHRVG